MLIRFFLERWWLLCAVLVVVEVVLFAVWTRRRTTFAGRMAWIGLAAAILLPIVSHQVVTQRERIERLCHDMAHAIDIGDLGSLGDALSEDFDVVGLDKDAFLVRVSRTLTRYRIDNPSLRRMKVTFPKTGHAVAVFDAVCSVRSPDGYQNRLFSRWQVTLVGGDPSWRVITIEALPSPLSPIRTLNDYLR